MIFEGKRIMKVRDWDISPNSPLYVKDGQLPFTIVDCSFKLKDVSSWEEFTEASDEFYDGIENKELTTIYIKRRTPVVIVMKYKEFNQFMKDNEG